MSTLDDDLIDKKHHVVVIIIIIMAAIGVITDKGNDPSLYQTIADQLNQINALIPSFLDWNENTTAAYNSAVDLCDLFAAGLPSEDDLSSASDDLGTAIAAIS